ncbi:MAG: hypothetical protein ACHQ2Z_15515, partial [Elusimicrobiota bacterium]
MRTRRAAALLLAAALASLLPRPAAAGDYVLDRQILHDTTNGTALALNFQRVALEKKILDHLTGKSPSSFGELKKTLDGIKAGLAAATDMPGDASAALADLLLHDEKMLMGGAALARGAQRLDPKIEQVFRAVADKHEATAADEVSTAVARLLNVAATPEAADQLFDNRTPAASRTKAQQNAAAGKARLRASLGDDPAAAANLDAVLADFGTKAAIVYTQPQDPLYKYTNAAKFSHAATAATPAPAKSDVSPEAAANLTANEASAADNCAQATSGTFLPVGKLCKSHPVAAAMLGGLLDAIKQQLGTVEGVVTNIVFILLGLAMGLLTGGVGLAVKVLAGLGMGLYAIYKLVPAFGHALTDYWYGEEGSVRRYAAIRQLAALFGGIAIMLLLAMAGGKIAKLVPETVVAKVGKFQTNRLEGGLLSKIGELLSPKKGIAVAAEESGAGTKTGKVAKLAQKTANDFLKKEIKPGERVTPVRARELVAKAFEKAHDAVRENNKINPKDAPTSDLTVAVVAQDASGADVLVSAKAGDGALFVQRDGLLIQQRAAPPVLERFAAVEEALKSDGLSPTKKVSPAELKGAENLTKLAEKDPVLKKMLSEAESGARHLETQDWMEYKERVAAEPRPETALGSPRYKPPVIIETVLKPRDVVFTVNRGAAEAVGKAHGEVAEGTPSGKYLRALLDTEQMRGRTVAELSVPEEPGFFARLAARVSSRESNLHRLVGFQANSVVTPPPPPGPPGPCTGPNCGQGKPPCVGPDCDQSATPCSGDDCDEKVTTKDDQPCVAPACPKETPVKGNPPGTSETKTESTTA